MTDAIRNEQPDICIFLGDGERDLRAIEEKFPKLPVYAVRGNCDFTTALESSFVRTFSGVTVFASHGHRANVKYEYGYETLTSQAVQAGANIALFGHTHQQHLSYSSGVMLLNPGAAHYRDYAVLIMENGKYEAELKTI